MLGWRWPIIACVAGDQPVPTKSGKELPFFTARRLNDSRFVPCTGVQPQKKGTPKKTQGSSDFHTSDI